MISTQCDTGEAWGKTRQALARVRCGSGVSGGAVCGLKSEGSQSGGDAES